ncbi:MAG: response regulator transcription factor, partial [Hyphomonadaceae bacterium]
MRDDASFDADDLCALVLDQNHYQRGISLDQLRAMGFRRAHGAADTVEAWDLICLHNPDLVVLEWLDGTDALDFVRRLRMSDEAPNRAVAVFMLTTRGSAVDVEAARRAGVDGYMRKPISSNALKLRVKAAIENPQPFIVTASYVGPCRRRRSEASFAGPWRRLDDVVPKMTGDDEEQDLKAELARARVAALEACANALQPGDAAAARAVFKAVQNLIEVADQIGDINLSFGGKEMARYIQAQGATDRLEPEVVRTHVAALHQLVHLPHVLAVERERVAQSLKR